VTAALNVVMKTAADVKGFLMFVYVKHWCSRLGDRNKKKSAPKQPQHQQHQPCDERNSLVDVSSIKHRASDCLIVRVETDLNHVVRGLVAVDGVFTSLVEMLQCSVRIPCKPVRYSAAAPSTNCSFSQHSIIFFKNSFENSSKQNLKPTQIYSYAYP